MFLAVGKTQSYVLTESRFIKEGTIDGSGLKELGF